MLSSSYYFTILQDSEKRLSRMCSIFTIAVHVGQCLKETADKVREGEREREKTSNAIESPNKNGLYIYGQPIFHYETFMASY